jgi:integrase/recombinase XerD
MRKLKHLPVDQWPEADIAAFAKAYEPGDIFDETAGPGAHLAEGTRRMIRTAYRRWLGFLTDHDPGALRELPAARMTPDRLCAFVEHLNAEVRATTVAHVVDNLHYAARLIAPNRDWSRLASLDARLAARAEPQDRFDRLVPGWQTLNLGIELMETASALPSNGHRRQEIQYRDGLLLALLSLWLIRRRSLTALTASRHVEHSVDALILLLYQEDTKGKRAESFTVPERLLPYLRRYLQEIRPRLLRGKEHDGLWASYKGGPLCDSRIYSIVRERVFARFGKAMSLHDFRRAAATFVAMDAPDLIGLVPGILQHASPDVSERHYNLARSVEASRRFAAHLEKTRAKLRPIQLRNEV